METTNNALRNQIFWLEIRKNIDVNKKVIKYLYTVEISDEERSLKLVKKISEGFKKLKRQYLDLIEGLFEEERAREIRRKVEKIDQKYLDKQGYIMKFFQGGGKDALSSQILNLKKYLNPEKDSLLKKRSGGEGSRFSEKKSSSKGRKKLKRSKRKNKKGKENSSKKFRKIENSQILEEEVIETSLESNDPLNNSSNVYKEKGRGSKYPQKTKPKIRSQFDEERFRLLSSEGQDQSCPKSTKKGKTKSSKTDPKYEKSYEKSVSQFKENHRKIKEVDYDEIGMLPKPSKKAVKRAKLKAKLQKSKALRRAGVTPKPNLKLSFDTKDSNTQDSEPSSKKVISNKGQNSERGVKKSSRKPTTPLPMIDKDKLEIIDGDTSTEKEVNISSESVEPASSNLIKDVNKSIQEHRQLTQESFKKSKKPGTSKHVSYQGNLEAKIEKNKFRNVKSQSCIAVKSVNEGMIAQVNGTLVKFEMSAENKASSKMIYKDESCKFIDIVYIERINCYLILEENKKAIYKIGLSDEKTTIEVYFDGLSMLGQGKWNCSFCSMRLNPRETILVSRKIDDQILCFHGLERKGYKLNYDIKTSRCKVISKYEFLDDATLLILGTSGRLELTFLEGNGNTQDITQEEYYCNLDDCIKEKAGGLSVDRDRKHVLITTFYSDLAKQSKIFVLKYDNQFRLNPVRAINLAWKEEYSFLGDLALYNKGFGRPIYFGAESSQFSKLHSFILEEDGCVAKFMNPIRAYMNFGSLKLVSKSGKIISIDSKGKLKYLKLVPYEQ